jgi:hypothetical protein
LVGRGQESKIKKGRRWKNENDKKAVKRNKRKEKKIKNKRKN